MFKMMAFLSRKPGMSPEELQEYYETPSCPAGQRGCARYPHLSPQFRAAF